MALARERASVKRPASGLASLVWRFVVIGLVLGLAADGFLPTALEPAARLLKIRRAQAGGAVVIESQPALTGQEVEVAVYGPIGAPSGRFSSKPGFFGVAGVQIPWLAEEDREAEMILAAASGARSIGLDFEWKKIQTEAGRWEWEETDEVVRLAKKYNLRVVPMLMYTPEWASSLPFAPMDYQRASPVRYSLYRDFVYQVVNRYKPYGAFTETRDGYGITDWVIWNEPNVQPAGRDPLPMNFWYGSLEDYIQLLRAGFEGAHAADPGCNVLNGGLADVYWKPGEADLVTAVERLYDPNGDGNAGDGGRAFFDTLNLHIYPPGKNAVGQLDAHWYQDRLDAVLRIMARYGDTDKKIWITETGYGSTRRPLAMLPEGSLPLVSEADQARAVALVYETLAAYPQVERVFWWSVRNLSANEADSNVMMEAHYGLVRANFYPKPAYYAYMRIAGGAERVYAARVNLDPSGITVVNLPPGRLQKPGQYFILAAASEDESGAVIDGAAAVGWLAVP